MDSALRRRCTARPSAPLIRDPHPLSRSVGDRCGLEVWSARFCCGCVTGNKRVLVEAVGEVSNEHVPGLRPIVGEGRNIVMYNLYDKYTQNASSSHDPTHKSEKTEVTKAAKKTTGVCASSRA